MPKLYRPHIPLSVRRTIVTRQLLQRGFTPDPRDTSASDGKWLAGGLKALAHLMGCAVEDLRLDHDPPLGARPKHRRGLGKKTYYIPDANDPAHLFYRPHGPEHEGSHLVKTNVRGDHGQHPDRVLIKKQRRLEHGPKPKRGPTMKGRGFTKRTDKSTAKPKWPKRKFESRSRT